MLLVICCQCRTQENNCSITPQFLGIFFAPVAGSFSVQDCGHKLYVMVLLERFLGTSGWQGWQELETELGVRQTAPLHRQIPRLPFFFQSVTASQKEIVTSPFFQQRSLMKLPENRASLPFKLASHMLMQISPDPARGLREGCQEL